MHACAWATDNGLVVPSPPRYITDTAAAGPLFRCERDGAGRVGRVTGTKGFFGGEGGDKEPYRRLGREGRKTRTRDQDEVSEGCSSLSDLTFVLSHSLFLILPVSFCPLSQSHPLFTLSFLFYPFPCSFSLSVYISLAPLSLAHTHTHKHSSYIYTAWRLFLGPISL